MNIGDSYFEFDITFMIGIGFEHDPEIRSHMIFETFEIDIIECNYYINIDTYSDHDNKWKFVCLHLICFNLENEIDVLKLFFQFILLCEEIFETCYK